MTSSFLSHGQFLMSDNLWFPRHIFDSLKLIPNELIKNSQVSVVTEQEALRCSVPLDLLTFMLCKLHLYIII